MRKKVGVLMILFAVLLLIIASVIFYFHNKEKKNTHIEFSKEVAPYTKSKEESFTFEETEELNISSVSTNLDIKQEECSKITVKLLKKVGDTSEKYLEEAMEHIICEMKDGTLEIGTAKGYQSTVNSQYAKAELTIPKTMKSINIVSQTGNIEMEGSYDKIVIDSNTGEVQLNIKNLEAKDKFLLNGDIGNINIKLPKQSEIKLCGSRQQDIKLGDGILVGEDGAVIEVNKTTSRIKIIN